MSFKFHVYVLRFECARIWEGRGCSEAPAARAHLWRSSGAAASQGARVATPQRSTAASWGRASSHGGTAGSSRAFCELASSCFPAATCLVLLSETNVLSFSKLLIVPHTYFCSSPSSLSSERPAPFSCRSAPASSGTGAPSPPSPPGTTCRRDRPIEKSIVGAEAGLPSAVTGSTWAFWSRRSRGRWRGRTRGTPARRRCCS